MSDTKISEAAPAVYGIRVKGNLAIVGVLPVPLKDFPVKNPEWDERYEEVPLYLHPQPAELAEQKGVEVELPEFGINTANHAGIRIRGYTAEQMQEYARAALAATGRQQVGEVRGGTLLAELLEDSARAAELANRLIAPGPKAAQVSASETHEISDFVLSMVDLLPCLAARQPGAQVPVRGAVLIDGTVHLVQKGEEMEWARDRGATLLCAIDRSTRND